MTIESLSQLSDEELRVKVAEKMGYTDITFCPLMGFHQERSDERAKECGGRWRFALPPFSTSLDAIHEAEKTLKGAGQYSAYAQLLFEAVCGSKVCTIKRFNAESAFTIAHATARQRAIAFLLV